MNSTAALPVFSSNVPWRQRLAARLVLSRLRGWRRGGVVVSLPDGALVRLGDAASPRQVAVSIHDWRFFWRTLTAGDIGVGESYMAGEWECSDLVELCRMFVEDQSVIDATSAWTIPARIGHDLLRRARANTLRGSRRNIARHYDLGNDFYRLFLDEMMLYSAAVFPSPTSTLEEAQREKVDGICRRLELRPEHEVLEIGSGWGGFALHAAREYGCRVVSITLSQRQLEVARERAAAAGVADRVEFRLCDYRSVAGAYDRIVSIEMFEAVGYEYYGAFFSACDRRLRAGGRVFLQAITIPDQRFDAYRRDFDWIRKHVFPGSLLASVAEITRTLKTHTRLRLEWMRDIGPDYASTLRAWRQRFLDRRDEVRRLGFDEPFVRMWELYLASCEAAFAARYLGDAQMLLSRPLE